MSNEDYFVDAVITAGELDPNWYGHYLDNDLKVVEVVKHNIPYSQFLKWRESDEAWERYRELERIGRDRFGDDYWRKYRVCSFCTTAGGLK